MLIGLIVGPDAVGIGLGKCLVLGALETCWWESAIKLLIKTSLNSGASVPETVHSVKMPPGVVRIAMAALAMASAWGSKEGS